VADRAPSRPGPGVAPAAADRLRRHNTALVLRSLRDDGPASRAGLAGRTGLAKATVGAIVRDLVGTRAVREATGGGPATAPKEPVTGRPGRPVELDGSHTVALGLEVNVDYLGATALDLAGRVVTRSTVPVVDGPPTPQALARLAGQCAALLAGQGRTLLGVTVAVPGQVDPIGRRVARAPNLRWRDLDVVGAVTEALDGALGRDRVGLDNDANCAVAAEISFGAAPGATHLLYLTGTVGLGAGLVVDGVVRRGAHGLAGEVGHAPLGDPTRRCACGRDGCWETAVGLLALLRETGLDPTTGTGDPLSVAHRIAWRCRQADPHALAGVHRVATDLARGLATLVATLDPAVVVLGGSFVPLGQWVLPVVRARLAATSSCQVLPSALGLHAASTGAAAAVLADVYSGERSLG
jgi:predicted NBD/HSP70 family sugar kinase